MGVQHLRGEQAAGTVQPQRPNTATVQQGIDAETEVLAEKKKARLPQRTDCSLRLSRSHSATWPVLLAEASVAVPSAV